MNVYDSIDFSEFLSRFKLVCLKCGSDDTKIIGDEGFTGTGLTAGDPATVYVGCNACKQNDMRLI